MTCRSYLYTSSRHLVNTNIIHARFGGRNLVYNHDGLRLLSTDLINQGVVVWTKEITTLMLSRQPGPHMNYVPQILYNHDGLSLSSTDLINQGELTWSLPPPGWVKEMWLVLIHFTCSLIIGCFPPASNEVCWRYDTPSLRDKAGYRQKVDEQQMTMGDRLSIIIASLGWPETSNRRKRQRQASRDRIVIRIRIVLGLILGQCWGALRVRAGDKQQETNINIKRQTSG